jgi:hypothetical protein
MPKKTESIGREMKHVSVVFKCGCQQDKDCPICHGDGLFSGWATLRELGEALETEMNLEDRIRWGAADEIERRDDRARGKY